MAVETNLIDIIPNGFGMFEDDEERRWLSADPANCALISAVFADSHAQLDLLIYLRACEIAGVRARDNGFDPNRRDTCSRYTIDTCWRSFRRLVQRFEECERLAMLQAECLRREAEGPLRLDAPHQASTLRVDPAALRAVEANQLITFNVQTASLSAQHWGRWIATTTGLR